MTMEAKPVVKNKFWVVEEGGRQVATIQASPDGLVLVKGHQREKFVNFKLLKDKYNIQITKGNKQKKEKPAEYSIYGFPTDGRPHNMVYDVRRRLPFYTKTAKSKSYRCAGHYAICLNGRWAHYFCPKKIMLGRYKHLGPFQTNLEAITQVDQQNVLKAVNGV